MKRTNVSFARSREGWFVTYSAYGKQQTVFLRHDLGNAEIAALIKRIKKNPEEFSVFAARTQQHAFRRTTRRSLATSILQAASRASYRLGYGIGVWFSSEFADDKLEPPHLAEALFALLAPKKTVDAQLGDLEESFRKNCAKLGRSRARLLYWAQVLRAVGPSIWRRVKKLGFIGILIDYSRSKLGF